MSRLKAKSKRITAFLIALIYAQSFTIPALSQEEEEQVNLVQTEPAAAPAIQRDDNFLDPRGSQYISKWLKDGQYMPLSELKPGMQGYGLTVFQGSKIERFDVTVIGVVKKVLSGRDAVMVRLSGPLMGKNTVIRGMSGSPVYINNKLVGAISYGFDFSREPIVGLTPITDMLDALTPDKRPADDSSGRGHIGFRKLPSFGAERGSLESFATESSAGITTTSGGGAKMVPLIAPISLSGFSSDAQEFLAERFKSFGMAVSSGTAGAIDETLDDDANASKNYPGETIKPGGAVSVLLVTGDFSASATGTATTTFGGNVLAFGHPFMQAGPVDFPMATAYIHQVLPNLAVSFKVASPVKVVGAIVNDRPWAIGGELGRQSKMIPATYTVTDRTRGVKKTFHLNVINHADLTPELLASTAMSAIDTTHQSTSPYVVSVDSTVLTDKVGTIERHDKFAGNFAVHGPVDANFKLKGVGDSTGMSFLGELTRIVNNDFETASIKGVNLNIVLDDGHETARLERISLDKQKVEPGDTVTVSAILRPYNKPRVTRELHLKVPRDIPDGNLLLGVGPGDQIDQLRKRMGILDPQPENLHQVANRIREQSQGNVLEAVLALPEQSLFLDGKRIVSPPANWLKLFFSDRYTKGPQIVKGEIRARTKEPWLLDGMHLLALTVEHKEKAMAQSPFYNVNPNNSFASQDGIYMTDQARKALDSGQSRKNDTSSSPSSSSSSTSSSSSSSTSTAASSNEKRETTSNSTTFSASKQYPHMRSAQAWRQSTEEDFRNGKADEVAIDSRGRLSPGFHQESKVSITPEMQIWSSACANGQMVFSAHNKIFTWTAGGQNPQLLAKLDCSFCPSIAIDSKGTIYAAAAPSDRVLRVKPNAEKPETLFKTGGNLVSTLCVDDHDNVYAGVASEGKLWKYDATQKSASVIFDTGQAHITSLWFNKADKRIYVGTAEKGAVYSVSSGGEARAEYQTNNHIVTGAVKDSRGNLYVTTAGPGVFLKVKPSAETETIATSESFYSLAYDPISDTAFAGDAEGEITQARVEEIANRTYFVPVAHTDEEAVSALSIDGQGHLFAATSNFARCFKFDLVPSNKATYTSQIRDAQRPATWSKLLTYSNLSEVDSSLMMRLGVDTRTGNSGQPDASWSQWVASEYNKDGFLIKSPKGRYLQYRIHWKTGEKGTEQARKGHELNTIRKVDVTYLPANSQPTLSNISIQAGSHLSGKQEISITGTDSDHDNMLLSLDVSSDDGKTWTSLATDLRSKRDAKDNKDKKGDKDQSGKNSKSDENKDKDKNGKTDTSSPESIKSSSEKGDGDKTEKSDANDKDEKEVKEKAKDKDDESDADSGKGDEKPAEKSEEKSSSRDKAQAKAKESGVEKNSKSNKKLSEKTQKIEKKGDESLEKKSDLPGADKDKQAEKPKTETSLGKDKTKSKAKEAENALTKALNAIKASTGSNEAESQTEQFTYSWDTSKQKDGKYLLRLKLNDRLSNPSGFMENERWGTVTVDNTPPEISDVKLVSAENGNNQLTLKADDKLSLITNATYKIDDGSAFAMMRVDDEGKPEAADSQSARLIADLVDVKSGEHKFVIEVTDQAGNTETKTVTLTVK